MFQRKMQTNQPKFIPLTKSQSSYKKLEKEMNKALSEYEQIKKLIENNDIESIDNKKPKNDLVKLIPHKKK